MTTGSLCRRLFVAALVVVGGGVASRADTLDEATEQLAKKAAKYLKEKSQTSITIGTFEGPRNAPGDLQIRAKLASHLKKMGVEVGGDDLGGTGFELRGQFTRGELTLAGNKQVVVHIAAQVFDTANNQEQVEFRARGEVKETVTTQADVAALTAPTFDATASKQAESGTASSSSSSSSSSDKPAESASPPGTTAATEKPKQEPATPVKVQKSLLEGLDQAKVSVETAQTPAGPGGQALPPRTLISAVPGSPYKVELLVAKEPEGPYAPMGDRVKVTKVGESLLAEADLSVGEYYRIKLYNEADHDVGVKIFIDGLNLFEFSEVPAYRDLGMVMIGKGTNGVIPGWYITNDRADSFKIAHLPDIEASKAIGKVKGKVGTIQAIFFAAWVGDTPPAVETLASKDGTARGPAVAGGYREEARSFGQTPLASVAVRYIKKPTDLPPGEGPPGAP